VANTLDAFLIRAVGFIDWLGSFDLKFEAFPSITVE
jgi:hypothetical protein